MESRTKARHWRAFGFVLLLPPERDGNGLFCYRAWAAAVAPLEFDRIYGACRGRNIASGARAAFDDSVRRYLSAIA
jgi:hypothetical protein